MPELHIDYNPRMTGYIVSSNFFTGNEFLFVDVGASGGIENHWQVLINFSEHIAFEADPKECKLLNAEKKGSNIRYYPYILSNRTGKRTFYFRGFSGGHSFYRLKRGIIERIFPETFVARLMDEREILCDVISFDDFAKKENVSCPNFIKLDVEGAELEILEGANMLWQDRLIGLCLEVQFNRDEAPYASFAEIDRFLQSKGFQIFDMDICRYGRTALPLPYLYDLRDSEGAPVPGPTTTGKSMLGDVLYFRDLTGEIRSGKANYDLHHILKACCFYEIYGFPDFAVELIIECKETISKVFDTERLLDLLAPEVKGKVCSFREHLKSFDDNPERFRPSPGFQYPDPRVSRYDGRFTPNWEASSSSVDTEKEAGARELEKSRAELEASKRELETAKRALEAAESKLSNLYSSSSWLITTPLRALMRFFSRLAEIRRKDRIRD